MTATITRNNQFYDKHREMRQCDHYKEHIAQTRLYCDVCDKKITFTHWKRHCNSRQHAVCLDAQLKLLEEFKQRKLFKDKVINKLKDIGADEELIKEYHNVPDHTPEMIGYLKSFYRSRGNSAFKANCEMYVNWNKEIKKAQKMNVLPPDELDELVIDIWNEGGIIAMNYLRSLIDP